MPGIKDISGMKFGRTTAIRFSRCKRGLAYWICQCECGTVHESPGSQLRQLKTQSCGCLRVPATTHGRTNCPTYISWKSMKQRCSGNQKKIYKEYFQRGITVCDRWLESFSNFYDDMGPRPSLKHQLERNNNDGNYEPSNCSWATVPQQSRNRRSSRYISYLGKNMIAKDWADLLGMKDTGFRKKLEYYSIEDFMERLSSDGYIKIEDGNITLLKKIDLRVKNISLRWPKS